MADVLTLPVRAVIAETPRTRVLRLDLDGSPFVFQAGQAALIGLHGQPQRRPYSIASAPEEASRHGRLEFLLKVDTAGYAGPHLPLLDDEPGAPGTGDAATDADAPHVARRDPNAPHSSDAVPSRLVGARIDLEGPFGSFTLPDPPDAPSYLFVAGGTGVAPLRAMVRHLVACGEQRPIAVVYSARTPDEFAYGPELQRLARHNRLSLTLTVTGDVNDWSGARGRIGLATLEAALPSRDALCFVCGPPALVDDTSALLRQLGVGSPRIRIEEW